MDELKRKYEAASIEAEVYKALYEEAVGAKVDVEKDMSKLIIDNKVLLNENETLRKEKAELEAQIIEIAQGKRAVDYGPMTDSAAKGEI